MAKEILERPVLKIKARKLDYFFEIIAALLLMGTWYYVINVYNDLPDTVAIHFNFKGEPDSFGSKSSTWAIPIVSTLLWMLLSIVNQFPHSFNFPYQLTEENVERQYRMAQRFMRIMKIWISAIFLFAVHSIVKASDTNSFSFQYEIYVILGSMFCFMAIYFYVSKKNK